MQHTLGTGSFSSLRAQGICTLSLFEECMLCSTTDVQQYRMHMRAARRMWWWLTGAVLSCAALPCLRMLTQQ